MRIGQERVMVSTKSALWAGCAVVAAVLLTASLSLALTWGEINQRLDRCLALTNEAITLVRGVKGTRDDKINKKAAAKLKKAENKLEQVIDIYQTLYQADLPPAKLPPHVIVIKSSLSGNLSLAKKNMRDTQSLRRIVEKEGLGLLGAGVQTTLLIDLRKLRAHTSLLQKRLRRKTSGKGLPLEMEASPGSLSPGGETTWTYHLPAGSEVSLTAMYTHLSL